MPFGAKQVCIDYLPESAFRYLEHDAVVCIDVMLTTTTLVTAAAQGRPAYVAASLADAVVLERRLGNALLAVEGLGPSHSSVVLRSSPALLLGRPDRRPLVLAANCGARLIANAAAGPAVYVACLRNIEATARFVARRHARVAVLGAGAFGQLRCEDQIGAARLARGLMTRGFEPAEDRTAGIVQRWSEVDPALVRLGSSAEQLRRAGQNEDVELVVRHLEDLDLVCRMVACGSGTAAVIAAVPAELAAVPALRQVG